MTVGPTTMPTRRVSTPCSASAPSSTRPRSSTALVSTVRLPDTESSFDGGSRHREPSAAGPRPISSCWALVGSNGVGSATTTDGDSGAFFLRVRLALGGASASWSKRATSAAGGILLGQVDVGAEVEQVGEPLARGAGRWRDHLGHTLAHLAERPAADEAGGDHAQHDQHHERTPTAEHLCQAARNGAEEASTVGVGIEAVGVDGASFGEEQVEEAGRHQHPQHDPEPDHRRGTVLPGDDLVVLVQGLQVDVALPGPTDEQHATHGECWRHQERQPSEQRRDEGADGLAEGSGGVGVDADAHHDGQDEQRDPPQVVAVAVDEVAQRRGRLLDAPACGAVRDRLVEPLVERDLAEAVDRLAVDPLAGRDEAVVARRGLDLPEPERLELEVRVRVATVLPTVLRGTDTDAACAPIRSAVRPRSGLEHDRDDHGTPAGLVRHEPT